MLDRFSGLYLYQTFLVTLLFKENPVNMFLNERESGLKCSKEKQLFVVKFKTYSCIIKILVLYFIIKFELRSSNHLVIISENAYRGSTGLKKSTCWIVQNICS